MKTAQKPAPGKSQQPPARPFFAHQQNAASLNQDRAEPAFFNQNSLIQPKLKVNQPNDHFEKQADAVADRAVQKINHSAPGPIQAQPENNSEKEKLQKKEKPEEQENGISDIQKQPVFESDDAPHNEQPVRRKNINPEEPVMLKAKGETAAPSAVENSLNDSKSSGSPLPDDTRQSMESAMGADFSGVRVHTGSEAAHLSNQLGAQAFTHGHDIYFNDGKYNPGSDSGNHLLAHELTHTVQQGAAVQKKPQLLESEASSGGQPQLIQRATAPATGPAPTSTELVDVGKGTFEPSEKLKTEIEEAGSKGVPVNIKAGNLGGPVEGKIKGRKGQYDTLQDLRVPLNLPYLAAAEPILLLKIDNNTVTGYVTTGKLKGKSQLPEWIRKNATVLGWAGIDVSSVAGKFTNDYSGGILKLSLNDVGVTVGGFAKAQLTAGFENLETPLVNIKANVNVKGMAEASLDINYEKGRLAGKGEAGINYKAFAGNVILNYNPDGTIDVRGTVSYSADKLSGSLTLIATDKKTADNFARDQLKGVEPAEATLPAEVPAPDAKAKERALAGMGTLTFNLTEWFAGTVTVIVDGKGDVTVVGKIAPPKEIILFEQKDYIKEIFKLEARAAYGVPYIGNIFVFANVGLSAIAKVGPAKIYNIEVAGTYSTDPEIAKNISLSGSLNISAYAGLRLRAEGGAGIEVLSHDLKIGVGVNADAGVKGYVDARPTIGYRDPGEFFFKGHMEIGAQPFLGLSGDFFVELDSPWWSPAPDKKWTWPLGAMEYPLPGEFGIGADMEYVLGSGKVPEITFSEAKFDGAKFMTDLVDDHVPPKSGGGKGDKQGKFVDGGATGASPKPAETQPGDKGGDKKAVPAGGKPKEKDQKDDKTTKEELKRWGDAMKELEGKLKGQTLDKQKLLAVLNPVKARYKLTQLEAKPGDGQWIINAALGKNQKTLKVKGIIKPEDLQNKEADPEKQKKLDAGIKALKEEDKKTAGNGKLNKEEAEKVAKNVKGAHGDVFKSITVLDGGENWKYHYIQKKDPEGDVIGSEEEKQELPGGLKDGDDVVVVHSGAWKAGKILELKEAMIWIQIISGKKTKGTKYAFRLKDAKLGVNLDKLDIRAQGEGKYYPELIPEDLPDIGPKKHFSGVQKARIIERNIEKYGTLKSDASGQPLLPTTLRKKGVKVDPNEVNIDHVFPRTLGGWNSYGNAAVLSMQENIKKSDIVNP